MDELPDPGELDTNDTSISYGLFGLCGHQHDPLEMVGLMRKASTYVRRQADLRGVKILSRMRTDVVELWQLSEKDQADMPPGVAKVIRVWCRLDKTGSGSGSPPPASTAGAGPLAAPATSGTATSGGTTLSPTEGTGSTEGGRSLPSSGH